MIISRSFAIEKGRGKKEEEKEIKIDGVINLSIWAVHVDMLSSCETWLI